MKKNYKALSILALLFCSQLPAQVFSPIASSGYTLDAIAENTTALSTTSGPIDGSDYVMYSAAYGALYSNSYGLPNSGLVTSGTRTYQLQSYTSGNVLYALASQTGTITLNTPALYAGVSLLGFATEGTANFDVTFTYTDNTSQVFASQSFPDWFTSGNTILSGFDRCGRTSGTPANSSGNPKLYALDYGFNCVNRSKALASISVVNTSSNTSRLCILAISGTGAPSFSTTSNPVTCVGGTNGSAGVTASGGIPPYTYTWSTTPVQSSSLIANVGLGVYTCSVQDNGGCIVTKTISVTSSLSPEPALNVSSSAYTVCSGSTFTLGASGAATYTWMNGSNSYIYAPNAITTLVQTTGVYTVSGITSVNCLRTGSISILVNPLPLTSFGSSISPQCKTNLPLLLSPFVQQTGGTFTGPGVTSGSFIPNNAGVGTWTINYAITNTNNCTNSATMAVQVTSLAVPSMTMTGPYCSNATAVQMSVNIAGGAFTGTGTSTSGLFSPSIAGAGSHPVLYTLTNGPCTTSTAITILVNAAPTASIVNPKTFFCTKQQAVFLNGSPAGGTFTGSGVNNGAFNPNLASVSNSNIVVYTYTDQNGCTDTASVRITVSTCAGIDEKGQTANSIRVFPNPATNLFFIESDQETELNLINAIGQTVGTLKLSVGINRFDLNLTEGIYYFQNSEFKKGQSIIITH